MEFMENGESKAMTWSSFSLKLNLFLNDVIKFKYLYCFLI